MSGSGSALKGLSADMLAAGLIEASRLFGVDPLRCYERRIAHGKAVRACVGAAVLAVAGAARKRPGFTKDLAFALNVNATAFAPSGLNRSGVTTDHLLGVAEAMKLRGLDVSALEGGEVLSAPAATAVAAAPTAARVTGPRRFDPASLNDGPRRKPTTPTPSLPRQPDARIEATDSLKAMFGDDRPLVEACLEAGGLPVIDFTARPPRIVGGPRPVRAREIAR